MIAPLLRKGLAESGLTLGEEQIAAFELLAQELKKWNSRINLTSVIDDQGIAVKHIIDSLMFAQLVHDNDRVLDIGSGAGMPALPLQVYKPGVKVVSVDAVGKKIQFQRQMGRLLKLSSFEAIHARVEDLDALHRNAYSLITSRAFSSLGLFVSLALPFMAAGGRLIAMKGPAVRDEIVESESLLHQHGLKIAQIFEYELPFGLGARSLVTLVR